MTEFTTVRGARQLASGVERADDRRWELVMTAQLYHQPPAAGGDRPPRRAVQVVNELVLGAASQVEALDLGAAPDMPTFPGGGVGG